MSIKTRALAHRHLTLVEADYVRLSITCSFKVEDREPITFRLYEQRWDENIGGWLGSLVHLTPEQAKKMAEFIQEHVK